VGGEDNDGTLTWCVRDAVFPLRVCLAVMLLITARVEHQAIFSVLHLLLHLLVVGCAHAVYLWRGVTGCFPRFRKTNRNAVRSGMVCLWSLEPGTAPTAVVETLTASPPGGVGWLLVPSAVLQGQQPYGSSSSNTCRMPRAVGR